MNRTRKRFREPIDRDALWMGQAFMLAAGSVSSRQQGCIIVGTNHQPMGMGHDASPQSMQDGDHVVHAEINALLNCKQPLAGGTAYITHTPCYHCVMALLASNIRRIIYFPTKTPDEDTVDAVRCGYAQLEEFKGNLNWMRDYLRTLDVF